MPIVKFAAEVDPNVHIVSGVILNSMSGISADVDVNLPVPVSALNSISALAFAEVLIEGIPVFITADVLNSLSYINGAYEGPAEIAADPLNSLSTIAYESVVAQSVIKSISRVVSTYADFTVHYPPMGHGSVDYTGASVVGYCGGAGDVAVLEDVDLEIDSVAYVSDIGYGGIIISSIEIVSFCGGKGEFPLPFSQIDVSGSAYSAVISHGDISFNFNFSGTGKQESIGSAAITIAIRITGSGFVNAHSYGDIAIQLLHISAVGAIGALGDADVSIEGYPDSIAVSSAGTQRSYAAGDIDITDEFIIEAMSTSGRVFEELRYPWET